MTTTASSDGVASMLLAAGSAVLGCDGGRELLSTDGVCMMAAEAAGPGLVLAFADLTSVASSAATRGR